MTTVSRDSNRALNTTPQTYKKRFLLVIYCRADSVWVRRDMQIKSVFTFGMQTKSTVTSKRWAPSVSTEWAAWGGKSWLPSAEHADRDSGETVLDSSIGHEVCFRETSNTITWKISLTWMSLWLWKDFFLYCLLTKLPQPKYMSTNTKNRYFFLLKIHSMQHGLLLPQGRCRHCMLGSLQQLSFGSLGYWP